MVLRVLRLCQQVRRADDRRQERVSCLEGAPHRGARCGWGRRWLFASGSANLAVGRGQRVLATILIMVDEW
jgi:hypothetical protein